MRRANLFNEMDALGAGAVLAAYLTWALYQVNRQGRNPLEVHIALAVALIVGLAYRLLWQRMPRRASEIFARLLLGAAGILVSAQWVTESTVLVASANLRWLLRGACLKRMQEYASLQLLSVLYFLLMVIPRGSDASLFAGLFIGVTGLQRPAYLRSWQPNPYEYLFGSLFLFAIAVGAAWILVAPTAETARAQLGQRLMVGFGLILLLIVLFWSVGEWRKGFGQSRPPDAGVRSPVSPVPSASAGNAQKLPED